jgi:cell division protease FtsH
MAQIIDEEVQKLLRESDESAYKLLHEHREDLDRLAEALVQREELHREEIEELLKTGSISTAADGQPAERKEMVTAGK